MATLNERGESTAIPVGMLVDHLQEGQMLRHVGFTGRSMLPMLRQKTDFLDLAKPSERLRKYDLPLYVSPGGKYVMHRIVKVGEGHYICRGDNTYRPEYVAPQQIVAVVRAFYRGNKRTDVDSAAYKLYCRAWCAAYPLRKALVMLRRAAYRTAKKLLP